MRKASNIDAQAEQSDISQQINHQIESKRHYENLSWQLIRLLLSIVGFILTALSILASIIISRGFSILPNFGELVDLEYAARQLSNIGFLNRFAAAFLVTILTFSIVGLLLLAIYDIYFKSLSAAFRLQEPRDIKFGRGISSEGHYMAQNIVEDKLRYSHLHNEPIVSDIQEEWGICLNHLRRGSISLSVLILLVAPSLIIANTGILLLSVGVLSILTHGYLDRNDKYTYLYQFPYRIRIDSGIILSISLLGASFLMINKHLDASVILMLISLGTLPIVTFILGLYSGHTRPTNKDYIRRNGILFYLFLVLAFIVSFTGAVGNIDVGNITTYLILVSVFFLPPLFGCIIGILIKISLNWLRNPGFDIDIPVRN